MMSALHYVAQYRDSARLATMLIQAKVDVNARESVRAAVLLLVCVCMPMSID